MSISALCLEVRFKLIWTTFQLNNKCNCTFMSEELINATATLRQIAPDSRKPTVAFVTSKN